MNLAEDRASGSADDDHDIVHVIGKVLRRNLKTRRNPIVSKVCHIDHQTAQLIIIDHHLPLELVRKLDQFNDAVEVLVVYRTDNAAFRVVKDRFNLRGDPMIRRGVSLPC